MGMQIQEKEVVFFQTKDNKEPFVVWLEGVRDKQTRRRILQRLSRVQSGNYGDFKSLKDGVFELRLHFGSGYRIYFAEDGGTLVILLCGGDKSTQEKDIETAKAYWQEYLNE